MLWAYRYRQGASFSPPHEPRSSCTQHCMVCDNKHIFSNEYQSATFLFISIDFDGVSTGTALVPVPVPTVYRQSLVTHIVLLIRVCSVPLAPKLGPPLCGRRSLLVLLPPVAVPLLFALCLCGEVGSRRRNVVLWLVGSLQCRAGRGVSDGLAIFLWCR